MDKSKIIDATEEVHATLCSLGADSFLCLVYDGEERMMYLRGALTPEAAVALTTVLLDEDPGLEDYLFHTMVARRMTGKGRGKGDAKEITH